MHRLLALCFYLGSTGIGWAAPDLEPTPAPDPAPVAAACDRELDLHAVDAVTHEAIAGATVERDGQLEFTDADGHVVWRGLCPGPQTLVIRRDDYLEVTRTVVLDDHLTFEVELTLATNEVVQIVEVAPPKVELRATATLSGAALERRRGQPLAEALTAVPGVTQLRAGTGVGKPMIRGLFGRRLVLTVDGVRHRAQEWGLDHAPEVDPFAAGALTVVRGAAGVHHGPDALGGAIELVPPPLPRRGTDGEIHLIGDGPGLGAAVAARVAHAPAGLDGFAWQAHGSARAAAGAYTPDYPLDNTGAREWNLGARAGFRGTRTEWLLAAAHHQAKLGVCSCLRLESRDDFLAQLEAAAPLGAEAYTSSFDIERPSQTVAHDLVLARVRVDTSWGGWISQLAYQHDRRREFDVVRDSVTGAQFAFRLHAIDASSRLEHRLLHLDEHLHARGSVGVVVEAQANQYTGLPLIPDYTAGGLGAYAVERLLGPTWELEAGVRLDGLARRADLQDDDFARLVRSDQLAADACDPEVDDVVRCASRYLLLSASIGGLWQHTRGWATKLDLSTAARPPSADEQYLNGTAPTFPVLALGKPDLGAERVWATSVTTSYRGARLAGEVSAFASLTSDYIDFAPALDANGEPIFDVLIRGTFPRFITRAVDAHFYGVDGDVRVRAQPWLELALGGALVRGRDRSNQRPLGFVPPDRIRLGVVVETARWGHVRAPRVGVDVQAIARQGNVDLATDLAPPPPGVVLVGAELGGEVEINGHPVRLNLTGHNLTNRRYRDYTSLLRYFADQPGWQASLRITVPLGASARAPTPSD